MGGGYEDPRDRNRDRFRDNSRDNNRESNLKFVPPPQRSNGRPEEEFIRDRDGPFRQRDRFERNDIPSRHRSDDGPPISNKLNEDQERDSKSKSEEKDIKKDDNKSHIEGVLKDENSEQKVEGAPDSKPEGTSFDKKSGEIKELQNSMEGPPGENSKDIIFFILKYF